MTVEIIQDTEGIYIGELIKTGKKLENTVIEGYNYITKEYVKKPLNKRKFHTHIKLGMVEGLYVDAIKKDGSRKIKGNVVNISPTHYSVIGKVEDMCRKETLSILPIEKEKYQIEFITREEYENWVEL